jgi:lactate dehydrogenase-like 2-hydroxyacid dehydrogenase
MTKPVLLVTRQLPDAVAERARQEFDARLNQPDLQWSPDEIVALAQGADAILCFSTDRLLAPTIAALPASVKAMATCSVGYDHVDAAAAAARGIPVANTPDVLSIATAEIAMLLILMSARRAGEGERLVRSGQWQGWAPMLLLGTQISGKRLGIFGMGRIGRELAKMARGFGMTIHYRNRTRLPEDLEQGAIYHDSDESFLAHCDALALTAPGGAGTAKWLNAERLALLPRGAIVANAARGTLVDDEALQAALRSGQVAFAGLDVYDGEPNLHQGYFGIENVVLLPHMGSSTTETRAAMGHLCLDAITTTLAGGTPHNLIRP